MKFFENVARRRNEVFKDVARGMKCLRMLQGGRIKCLRV